MKEIWIVSTWSRS